jgi:FtsP/CotA-like multicopper oxidase with cupredoxin domain
LSEGQSLPRPHNLGFKDTVLVGEDVELLIRFDHPASKEHPFMYHCHILEHEDAGMMGQFTVS